MWGAAGDPLMPPAECGPAAGGYRCRMKGAAAALVDRMLMLPVPAEALKALTECQVRHQQKFPLSCCPSPPCFGVLGFVWEVLAVALPVDTTACGGTVRNRQPAL